MLIFLLIPSLIYILTRGQENRRHHDGNISGNHQNDYGNLNLNSNNRDYQNNATCSFVQNDTSPATRRVFDPSNEENPKKETRLTLNTKANSRFFSDNSADMRLRKKSDTSTEKKDFSQNYSTLLSYNNAYGTECIGGTYLTGIPNKLDEGNEKGCFKKLWDAIKSPFTSPKKPQSNEVMQPKHLKSTISPSQSQRTLRSQTKAESALEKNFVPLNNSARNYIEKLVTDIHSTGRWGAITKHFEARAWLGEDDITNLIRLAAASLPFPQKFAWVTAETMSVRLAGYNYFAALENYNQEHTDIVFMPYCNGNHFTLWIYATKANNLVYYDPKNQRPSPADCGNARRVVNILFGPATLPSILIQKLPEAMKQKSYDSYNCGIILFDIILCIMKDIDLFTANYCPNTNRKRYFELLETVYERHILPASCFLPSSEISDIVIPRLPSRSAIIVDDEPKNLEKHKENESPFLEHKKENNSKSAEKNGEKENPNDFLQVSRKWKIQKQKERFQNLSASGNGKRIKSQIKDQLQKPLLSKVEKKVKQPKRNEVGQDKSVFFFEMAKKNENGNIDFMDFDTPPTPPECEPFYLTPPPCSPVTSPAKSPKLKYNPRVVKKIPNSIWKAKKRLEAQMNPFFPGFRPEIVLHPEEMAPENSDEKLVQLKIGGKLKKSQIEKLTKCFPVPSYPTLMKKINATIPDIPDVNPADISERSNVIFKDFFSFAKARIQNSDKLPKKGPIRMGIQSDAGGGRTLFTFNFIDAPNPNSPNSHACFAMYDGSDKRECMYDIVENINDGAEKLQREGIIVNGVKRDVVCFLNGDLKIRCEFCGIQTGKPKKFCCKCKTENPKTLGEMRTIEEIAHNFNEFQAEYSAGKQNANRCKLLKQKYNNVNGAPLIPCIPLTRVVPPPLHILMALFNKFLFFVMCDEIQRFLNSLNVVTTQGRKEYNGNDCRKILQKISQSPKNFKGPHADVFILMAKVEKYAKAEPLTEKEMNDLENLIGQLFEKLDTFSCFKEGHKLHELRFHVIPFIREHGSWGLFSEQGLEALHHVFNDYRDKIIAKESDFKKNNYAFRSHMQQIFAFKM